MPTKLVKSRERVQAHGEVFTPQHIVNKMLNMPDIKRELKDLKATFLDHSAGEGAFTLQILNRKMDAAFDVSSSQDAYDCNALIALSSIYGIELLGDNFKSLLHRMYKLFRLRYSKGITKLNGIINPDVLKSAQVIIKANFAQGNALTGMGPDGKPFKWNEWRYLKNGYVKRLRYYYRDNFKKELSIARVFLPIKITKAYLYP